MITYPEKTNSFCDEGTGIIVEGKEFEDNFEKVLWISENPTEHELGTIRAHYRNLEYFMKNFKPILMKYDFMSVMIHFGISPKDIPRRLDLIIGM